MHDLVNRLAQQFRAQTQVIFAGGQRHQALDHFIVRATGLDDQALLEAALGDRTGYVGMLGFDTTHQATAFHREFTRVLVADRLQGIAQHLGLGLHFVGEGIVFPVGFNGSAGRYERHVVTTESTVVLTGFPHVQLRLEQHQRHRQAIATQGLGYRHDVRLDASEFKAEELAGPAVTRLDVIHNQQDVVLLAQLGQAFQPFGAGRIQTAFTLNGLNDSRRRLFNTGGAVRQHLVHDVQGVYVFTQVAVVEHEVHVAQGYAYTTTVMLVTGGGNGTGSYAVETVSERNDVGTAFHLAGQLHGRFHTVGTGELHLVVQATGIKDVLLVRFHEVVLGGGEQVQALAHTVCLDVLEQCFLQDIVVVAVVQGTGTGQEVQVLFAVFGVQVRVLGTVENHRKGTGINTNFGFSRLKNFHCLAS